MSIVLLLANTMDKYGSLEVESVLRAEQAAKIAHSTSGAEIITLGWQYRKDSHIAIADALKKYLEQELHVPSSLVNVELCSRDTVGDAIFSRLLLDNYRNQPDITVVTSDYHVKRVKEIFEFIFFGWANLSVVGVRTASTHGQKIHEEGSLKAFRSTFKTVIPGDIESALSVLLTDHPFYNGVIHDLYDFESHSACQFNFRTSRKFY